MLTGPWPNCSSTELRPNRTQPVPTFFQYCQLLQLPVLLLPLANRPPLLRPLQSWPPAVCQLGTLVSAAVALNAGCVSGPLTLSLLCSASRGWSLLPPSISARTACRHRQNHTRVRTMMYSTFSAQPFCMPAVQLPAHCTQASGAPTQTEQPARNHAACACFCTHLCELLLQVTVVGLKECYLLAQALQLLFRCGVFPLHAHSRCRASAQLAAHRHMTACQEVPCQGTVEVPPEEAVLALPSSCLGRLTAAGWCPAAG